MTSSEMKAIRVRLGMTQAELAHAIGWNRASGARHIRRYEKGIRIPPHIESKIRNLCPEEA